MATLQTHPQTTNRLRLDYLHGLRGLAALAVVVGHCVQLAQPESALPPLPLQWLRMAVNLAVPTFIVLSGYCLALPVVRSGRLEGGARGFLLRRAKRILPAYYGAIALSVLAAVTLTHTLSWAQVPGVALAPLLLLHDVWGSANAFDVPLWSLVIEWHIYCCVPALCWAGARYGARRAALLGLVVPFAALPLTTRLGLTQGTWPHLYTLFVLGWCAAHLSGSARWPALLPWGHLAALCALATGVALALLGWSAYGAHRIPFQLAWGVAMLCLLVHLSQPGGVRLTRALGGPALVWLGERSYSLYLLHWVPCTVLASALCGWGPAQHWPLVLRLCGLVAATVPASLCLAACSYRLLERPYLRGRRHAQTTAGAAAAAPRPAPWLIYARRRGC